ncbi:hypothetical protein [Cutibacterium phage vB_CutS_PA1]|nr:hypothetical protein [Cutibacterium phage vB_CutS_PA1]
MLWFLGCVGCDPTVKAALNRIERFMEGVLGVIDVTEALMASLSASNLLGVGLCRVGPADRF